MTRLAYGEGKRIVREWVAAQAPGLEFHFKDAAGELSMNGQSVSGILNRLQQSDPLALERGRYQGMYRIPVARAPVTAQQEPEPVANGHHAPHPDTGELMVVVGTLQDGRKMLRDENGGLWTAGKA